MKGGRWREARPFIVVLGCTIVLWLGMAMSEEKEYLVTYRVEWTGLDKARYAVTYADTALHVVQRTNGFGAVARSLRRSTARTLSIDLSASMAQSQKARITLGMNVHDMLVRHMNQMGEVGIRAMTPDKDSVFISLAERTKKAFVPVLKGVEYTFTTNYGVSGNAVVTPDTVWLYGAQEALDRIGEVTTVPSILANLSRSAHHAIDLDTAEWRRHGDVRASATAIDIFIPVEHYVERTFELPVRLMGMEDSSMQVRMYPERVAVTLTVPEKKYRLVGQRDLLAVAQYEASTPDGRLAVEMKAFPDFARVKSIKPNQVQVIVFK